ncbi:MAG: YqgE/AlgH family protein [Acidobacteriaceae bacterium]
MLIMFLRRPLLSVILAEIVACVAFIVLAMFGAIHASRPRLAPHSPTRDAVRANAQRLTTISTATLLQGRDPAHKLTLRRVSRGQYSDWNSPLWLPIQFRDPKDLGVGKLLVASRGLGDPNFTETVILLVHYDKRSVVGLILNRRSAVPISRIFDLKAARDRKDPVYLGGPVDPSVVFALTQSPVALKKAVNVFGQVYLISDKGMFERTLASQPDPGVFHVYLGYAGWTPDQLRNEIKLGAWYVFPAKTDAVFNSDPVALWEQMIQQTELESAQMEPLPAPFGRAGQ